MKAAYERYVATCNTQGIVPVTLAQYEVIRVTTRMLAASLTARSNERCRQATFYDIHGGDRP